MATEGRDRQIPRQTSPCIPGRSCRYRQLGGSGALHENILSWYNQPDADKVAPDGYSTWVREDSFKIFLVMSDTSSGPTLSGESFDDQLLALQPARFGSGAERNYRYHAIIGLQEDDPPSAPWLPSDPIVEGTCTGYDGAVAPGANAQFVAILTGGLRFPLCQTDKYDVVFTTIAEGIAKTTSVACEFAVPTSPDGKEIDPTTILLAYTPGGGGAPQTFSQAKNSAACADGKFIIEGKSVKLCPTACAQVQADPQAKIDVTYGCDVGFKP